jgi:hypothetical protein
MPSTGFELAVPALERLQTYAVETTTGIGWKYGMDLALFSKRMRRRTN